MTDPATPGMQQRRHYDAPGAGYAPQQYYQPYMPPYNNYQTQAMPSYQQPMPPQQWQYYNNAHYYPRAQPAYPPISPYPYQHHTNYQARPMPSVNSPSPYNVPSRMAQDMSFQQASVLSPQAMQEPAAVHISSSPPPPAFIEFSGHRAPYYPPLPWLSVPDQPFPPPQARLRPRRPRPQSASQPVEFPNHSKASEQEQESSSNKHVSHDEGSRSDSAVRASSPLQTEVSAISQGLSQEEALSSPTTPFTSQIQAAPGSQASQHGPKSSVVVPIVPTIPVTVKPSQDSAKQAQLTEQRAVGTYPSADGTASGAAGAEDTGIPSELVKSGPKSWAELLRIRGNTTAPVASAAPTAPSQAPDMVQKKRHMVGEAIASFVIQRPNPEYKLSFLEPRGLINSGNMCYMNSVLQVLVSCVPFYNFLGHVGRHAVYSFKSDTPLLDTMIMFMREFSVIDAAESLEKLRLRLKPSELEQFGEPLLPDYVYDEMRRMPRFATMQRGHQQDAEEFLGFLFEELHGECAKAIRLSGLQPSGGISTNPVVPDEKTDNGDGWLEVGPKQKASTTRSSGSVEVDTPINRIFGGQLRSELRIPGNKNSVTLEPYQSLQLDIGSPEVRNITDALQGLTKPETLHGDFQSPRGAGATATKQVFIESLPPVLILHLKRFQYDNAGGTQKIWKKVGYPLELEIPKEAFPHAKRGGLAVRGGLPKYRLISVIYHHGKSATAGHYTTDILRQDGRDWLRMDDTYIRRVRSQDVEGGSEEDPKILAAALEQHRRDDSSASTNIEEAMAEDGDMMQSDKGWSQPKSAGKKWSGVVNGTAKSSGRATPVGPQNLKDNKVAYILFYQKIEP